MSMIQYIETQLTVKGSHSRVNALTARLKKEITIRHISERYKKTYKNLKNKRTNKQKGYQVPGMK